MRRQREPSVTYSYYATPLSPRTCPSCPPPPLSAWLPAWLPAWPQREHRLWIYFLFFSLPLPFSLQPPHVTSSPQRFTQSHLSLRASKNICFLWPGVYAVLHVSEGNKPLLSYTIDRSSVNVLESSTTLGGGDKALDSMQYKVLSIVTKVLRKYSGIIFLQLCVLLQSPALKRQRHGSNKDVKSPHNFNTQYFYCLCYVWLHQKPELKKKKNRLPCLAHFEFRDQSSIACKLCCQNTGRIGHWALLLLPPSVMDCRCLAVL